MSPAGVRTARTEARCELVAQRTAEGRSAAEIADELGVTRRTVGRLRAMAGLTDGQYAKPWTPEQIELYDRLLTEGWSYREIGKTYNASVKNLMARFPGRGWTAAQKVELRHANAALNTITPIPTGLRSIPAGRECPQRAKPRQRRRVTHLRADRMVG